MIIANKQTTMVTTSKICTPAILIRSNVSKITNALMMVSRVLSTTLSIYRHGNVTPQIAVIDGEPDDEAKSEDKEDDIVVFVV